ncbi:transcriptional regulator of RNA polII, SAGA, subunit-domain-containing protein [Gigaspora margarita]|uniref:Transcriptional regulator of RNA polII, SAGA, subunit-domain-containing protein n=1 Tax=Gigaspora margarita TaxID=4874 RepID=A0A8H4ALM0_GIGMA|nr:transcriptional regulator of RNA polII, SAGA, subunit-domain-containing protein [Gigaspora margarita]
MNSQTVVKAKDPIMLKTQLDTALGDNKVQYWKVVQSFIKGELNRMELDFLANLFLTRENAQLHDDFIRASIKNNKQKSNCRVIRDIQKKTWEKSLNEKNDIITHHKSLKGILSSMEKEDRHLLHHFLKNAKHNRSSDEKGLIPKSLYCSKRESISQRDFPNCENVYLRMTEIAFNHELFGGVQKDCVSLMVLALEFYVKNILHNCINQIRENNVYHDDYDENHNIPSITLKDLAFSLSISPLSVSPLVEEKINARLRHDEMNFDNEI